MQVAKLKALSCVPFVDVCLASPSDEASWVPSTSISRVQQWAQRVRRVQLRVLHFALDMLESPNVKVRHAGRHPSPLHSSPCLLSRYYSESVCRVSQSSASACMHAFILPGKWCRPVRYRNSRLDLMQRISGIHSRSSFGPASSQSVLGCRWRHVAT
jgi:hypothetical protein